MFLTGLSQCRTAGHSAGHPLPLPMGEVAERSEDGEGKQIERIIQKGTFPTSPR